MTVRKYDPVVAAGGGFWNIPRPINQERGLGGRLSACAPCEACQPERFRLGGATAEDAEWYAHRYRVLSSEWRQRWRP